MQKLTWVSSLCNGGGGKVTVNITSRHNTTSGGATHLFDRPGLRPSRNPSEKASLSKGGWGGVGG